MNFRKTLLHRVSTKALFLTTIIALAAIAAVGLAVVPSFNGASKAAIEKVAQRAGDEVATAEMLKYALNFKSAAGYQTLAAASDEVDAKTKKDVYDQFSAVTQLPCTELADSNLGGKSFAAGVYCVNNAQLASQMTVDAGDDVSSVFVFLVRGNLNAKAGAGIALASGAQAANVFFVADESATLAEGVSLNANIVAKNNINVDGTSSVKGRMISVLGKVNGSAQSNLGGGTGTVQICKRVSNAAGTDISDRYYRFTVSGVPGVIEVYVPLTTAPSAISEACSSPFDVPVGPQVITELGTARLRTSAGGTFEPAPGSFVNFQLINVEQIRPTFPLTNPPGSRLGAVNLGARTAAITVVEGGPEGTLITRFTNVFAITGFIEICKQRATGPTLGTAQFGFSAQTFNPPVAGSTIPSGGDPDVTGFFSYTVEGVYSLNQLNTPNANTGAVATARTYQEFSVPVGGCTGNIAVTISNPPPTTTAPRESIVRVTELARAGFFLETVTTRPFCDREVQDATNAGPAGVTTTSQPVICPAPAPAANNQPFIPGNATPGGTSIGAASFTGGPSTTNGGEVLGSRIVPPTAIVAAGPNAPRGTVATDNLGGGYATVRVIEASAASETIVDFYNRSEPGTVKVCKIAGPGIPLGTLFRFSVFGPFGTTALGTPNHPQFSTYGPVSTIVDVTAGDPAAGGNCVLVPGLGAGTGRAEYQTFMNGTPVLVVENGVSPNNTTPYPPGAVRTSRIRVLGPTTGALVLQSGTGANRAGFTPNQCATFSATQNCNGLSSGDTTPDPAGFDGRNPGNTTAVQTPRIGRVAFTQRPGEVVAEFTNFLFNPTTLKICKNVTGTLAPGGSFNFTVTLRPESLGAGALIGTPAGPVGLGGALFPGNPTATASVISAVSQGAVNPFPSCTVVDGGNFPGGTFSVGQQITVVETAVAGTVVVRCDSPTNGGALLPATGAPVVGGACGFGPGSPGNPPGLVAGVNIIAFTNGPAGPVPPGEGATAFDFDGDGKADASIFRASTGTWSYAASSKGNEITSQRWGAAADKPVAADYDGDGKYDYAVFRSDSGSWYIIGSKDGYKAFQFGSAGDIPQPGDYDGDGKADAAVFRPSNGTWYMLGSSKGFSAVQFGVTTDRPVAADYDGDGKTDQAVYRASAGAWYLNKSRDGFSGVNWGIASDVPVPADYDGDGKADIAVYGTTGNRVGMWYQLKASGGFNAVNWGVASDKPVPADYDGDGKADISVYRSGMWYSLPTANTAAGYSAVELGNGSDTPVPAPLQ